MVCDYIGCLKLTSNSVKLESHTEVLRIADRIRKIVFDRLIKRNTILQKDEFPRILEKDVEKFMQEYSLQHSIEEDSNVDNSMDLSIRETRKCYKVYEESDEENSEIDSVNELS